LKLPNESNPLELAVEVVAGKHQCGGSAVRAMMLILGQVPLL
jgi:hypothetical protein